MPHDRVVRDELAYDLNGSIYNGISDFNNETHEYTYITAREKYEWLLNRDAIIPLGPESRKQLKQLESFFLEK